MAFASNFDNNPRGSFFAAGGSDDDNDGKNQENPKLTAQAAIQVAEDLDPPPGLSNSAIVSASQGGNFDDGFILPGFVAFEASDATFITNQAVSVTMGSAQICRTSGVQNSMDNSVCWKVDNESQVGIQTLFTGILGEGSLGFDVTGICNDLFFTSEQILLIGNDSIGYNVTGQSTSAIDMNSQTVGMVGDNTCLVDWNPSDSVTIGAIDVSTIRETGSGGEIFTVRNARLEVTSQVLDATSIATVEDGGRFGLDAHVAAGNITIKNGGVANVKSLGILLGDIVVESGGQLDAFILAHVGTITNNGTINGIINGVPFGNHRQKPITENLLTAFSLNLQEPPDGKDILLQVEFGPAQFGPTDPVQIDALGGIRFNKSDQYDMEITLQYGRIGAGSFVLLFFRALIDGIQIGTSQSAKLDNANSNFPVQFNFPRNILAGQILTIELWRDSTGFDEGGLFPEDPTLPGASSTPSAAIRISRKRLVQLVDIDSPPVVAGLVGLYNELGIVGETTVTEWKNSVVGLPDLDVVVGAAANLTRITALGFDVVNASGGVSLETTAGSLLSGPVTVLLVAQFNNPTPSANQVLIDARTSLTDRMMLQSRNASSDRFTIFQGSTLVTLDLADPYDTSPHIWIGQFNGDPTTTLAVDGVGTKTGDAGSGDWDFATFFADTTGVETSDAFIATAMVYDRALSAEELIADIDFLNNKYGL